MAGLPVARRIPEPDHMGAARPRRSTGPLFPPPAPDAESLGPASDHTPSGTREIVPAPERPVGGSARERTFVADAAGPPVMVLHGLLPTPTGGTSGRMPHPARTRRAASAARLRARMNASRQRAREAARARAAAASQANLPAVVRAAPPVLRNFTARADFRAIEARLRQQLRQARDEAAYWRQNATISLMAAAALLAVILAGLVAVALAVFT